MKEKVEIGSFLEGREFRRSKNNSFMKIVENEIKDNRIHFLCSGREAISAAIEDIEKTKGRNRKCLLPQYTCDTVIISFINHGWEVCFYPLEKNLEIDFKIIKVIIERETPSVLLLHPLYGMEINIETIRLLKEYKKSNKIIIIEDLTQALSFFKKEQWCNYRVASLRKWFAIPDGGLVISENRLSFEKHEEKKGYIKLKKEALMLKERYLKGDASVEKEKFLNTNNMAERYLYEHTEISEMSEYSWQELREIDVEQILIQRQRNADYLSQKLKKMKRVKSFDKYKESPLFCPILVDDRERIQNYLSEKCIYTSILWPVPKQVFSQLNKDMAYIYEHLLCIPCDQRYGIEDMEEIVYYIKQYEKGEGLWRD